ncbi:hypothetical protein [Bradyrhizobium canariense]|uniref:hypothetical protein n=1 Tax=Bradyrhizobium canariense TaxID=255045 RepID=UPI00143175AC|nr:hypothetical protein [Bradyrhizobium canariense]
MKRKKNALALALQIVGRTKIDWTDINENNMLTHRFSVAPMMDWTGTSRKAKYNQRLGAVVGRRAVPNAVPSRCEAYAGD